MTVISNLTNSTPIRNIHFNLQTNIVVYLITLSLMVVRYVFIHTDVNTVRYVLD